MGYCDPHVFSSIATLDVDVQTILDISHIGSFMYGGALIMGDYFLSLITIIAVIIIRMRPIPCSPGLSSYPPETIKNTPNNTIIIFGIQYKVLFFMLVFLLYL